MRSHRWASILCAGAILATSSIGVAGTGFTLGIGGGVTSSPYSTLGYAVDEFALDYWFEWDCPLFVDPWLSIAPPLTPVQIDPSPSTSWYWPLTGGVRLGVSDAPWTFFVGPMLEGMFPANSSGCESCGARQAALAVGGSAGVFYTFLPLLTAGLELRWAKTVTPVMQAPSSGASFTTSEAVFLLRLLNL